MNMSYLSLWLLGLLICFVTLRISRRKVYWESRALMISAIWPICAFMAFYEIIGRMADKATELVIRTLGLQ